MKKRNNPEDVICEVCDREGTREEELLNIISHGVGSILSALALVLVISKSPSSPLSLAASAFFCVSAFLLYTASFLFHLTSMPGVSPTLAAIRPFAMRCDHAMINLLILGSYAPVCLGGMKNLFGYIIFAVVALATCVGMTFDIVDVERFRRVNSILYIVTGWAIVLGVYPFYKAVGLVATVLLSLGGLSYTVGVLFYRRENIKYMHFVWHLFVLFGTACHFVMAYLYCL